MITKTVRITHRLLDILQVIERTPGKVKMISVHPNAWYELVEEVISRPLPLYVNSIIDTSALTLRGPHKFTNFKAIFKLLIGSDEKFVHLHLSIDPLVSPCDRRPTYCILADDFKDGALWTDSHVLYKKAIENGSQTA